MKHHPSFALTSLAAIMLSVTGLLFPTVPIAAEDSSNGPRTDIPQREDISNNDKVRRFIDEMVAQYDYPRERLRALLANVRFMPELRERLSRPAEGLPWHRYRKIFLTPDRIDEGTRFWRAHEDTLARAEAVHGVPPKVLVAILGVETYFGKKQGKYPVLDSLATLTFRNSMRTGFFRGELKQFLLLVREEEGLDAHKLKGSYAGAMGLPQFISSSYRRYAVDFDDDGRRDLFGSVADAIGSAAHYLESHGWQRGRGIAVPVEVSPAKLNRRSKIERSKIDDVLMKKRGSRPHVPFSALKKRGVLANNATVNSQIPENEKVALIELETEHGFEYWLGRQNFYAITRYNHSTLYAMAVHRLAEAIHARYFRGK